MPGDFFEKEFFFLKMWKQITLFVSQENHFFLMRRRLRWVIESSLEHTASCGDVVERVKSVYVQLSLISSAGHPLHQAVSLFFSKERTREQAELKKEQKRKN